MGTAANRRNFDAVFDVDLACQMRAEGATIREIALHFGVGQNATHKRVAHIVPAISRKRQAALRMLTVARVSQAEISAKRHTKARMLRAAGMRLTEIGALLKMRADTVGIVAKGVKPPHWKGKASKALSAARKPIVVAVPAWAERAGLSRDYRDLCRDFGEHHAARECRRLKAEAARPCL